MRYDGDIKKLSSVFDIISGGTPKRNNKDFWNGSIPWISIQDFNNNSRYIYDTEEYITKEGLEHSSTNILNKNNIIISARGTVGKVNLISKPMAFNQSCYGLQAKEGYNYLFLYYSLLNSIRELQLRSYGSVFSTITKRTFDEVNIVIFDYTIQCKIADILGSIDHKIEVNNKIIANLEEQAQAIFKSWFVDFDPFQNEEFIESELGMIPKGWEVIQLKEYLSFIRGVEPGSKNYLKCQDSDSIPFYRVGDLLSHSTTYVNHNLLKDKISHKDDILVSFDGTVGRVRIGISGGYSSGIRKIVSKENKYFPKSFIYFLFKSDYIQNIIRTYATGTTILHAGKSIDYMQIAYNSEVINKYNQIADPIFWSIINLQQQNQTLSELRDALLPKLMSGEIDVSQISVEDEVDES